MTGVIKVAAGSLHALAINNLGQIAAWGNNGWGQITIPSIVQTNFVKDIGAGHGHSIALLNDNRVIAWGLNTDRNNTTITLNQATNFTPICLGDASSSSSISSSSSSSSSSLLNLTSSTILRNQTIYGWRITLEQSTNIQAFNINSNTQFTVLSKTDTNLNIISITPSLSNTHIIVRWKYASNQNIGNNSNIIIRITDTNGNNSDIEIKFILFGRSFSPPSSKSSIPNLNYSKRFSLIVNFNDFFLWGTISPTIGGFLSKVTSAALVHSRRIDENNFLVWLENSNFLKSK
jgi:alpha-tubulin suppressor-like RCC1 family protein